MSAGQSTFKTIDLINTPHETVKVEVTANAVPHAAELERVVMECHRALQNIVPHLAHKVRVRVYTDEDGNRRVGVNTRMLQGTDADVVQRIVAYVARRGPHRTAAA